MDANEVKEILSILKEAYKRAAKSGGVTTYAFNSGQGNTSVKQASLAELRAEIEKYESLYNELSEIEDGSNFICIRSFGL